MPGPNRFEWLTFGLMLFATACSPPLGGPQAATDLGELSTPAQVARTEVTATLDIAEQVVGTPPEKTPRPTPTARPLTVTPEVEATLTETPAASFVDPTAEISATPVETPTVMAEAESAGVAPNEAEGEPGPTEEQLTLLAGLQGYGPAPELHNEVWLNSAPLGLAELRGQVVMVEFWTFG